jgi:carbon storage regulator
MLVLSRRLGEQIVIGGDIRIQVVAIQGNKVRIGITAPPGIRVDREEIRKRLQVRTAVRTPVGPAEKVKTSFDNVMNDFPEARRLLPFRGI